MVEAPRTLTLARSVDLRQSWTFQAKGSNVDADWVSPAIAAIGAVIVAGVSAIATLLVTRKPALITAEASAQTSLNDGFAILSETLMKRLSHLEEQNEIHETRLSSVIQHLESLEAILRDLGHPIPPRIWELPSPSVLGAKAKPQ